MTSRIVGTLQMEKIEAQLVLTQRVSLQPEAMKAVLLRTSRAHSLLEKPR